MKNKGQIWYIGYIVSLFLIVIILVTDFPKMVDIGLAILFSAVFGVSHVQILHDKMMKNKGQIWYIGYIVSLFLAFLMFKFCMIK